MKFNNYIEKVYRELIPYQNNEYEELYKTFSHQKLISIFSTIHHLLVYNFRKMNSRLPTGIESDHFWADNSRQLLLAIEKINGLHRSLKHSNYSFSLEPYYEKIINESIEFLSDSGGSTIPPFMEKIEIYYTEQIFISQNLIEVKTPFGSQSVELKLIGEGSYAKVFKYKDPFYQKHFVVKRAKDNLTKKELDRFKREYSAMKEYKSPYIVEVYSYNLIKNEYYMEHMDTTLDEYINSHNTKLSTSKRLGIVKQILRAFEYIHSKDNFHRDISPKNILIKNYEDIIVTKIADFGLIKIPNSKLTDLSTNFKGYFNDPSLIFEGFSNYDITHETYALTRIIIFVMTGKVNLDNINSDSMNSLMQKGLCTKKEERFQSVEELAKFFNKII